MDVGKIVTMGDRAEACIHRYTLRRVCAYLKEVFLICDILVIEVNR